MIEVTFAGMIYMVSLMGCYDGDTCTIRFENSPAPIEVQKIRFADFDTPEIKGKCDREKELAIKARDVTRAYMQETGKITLSGKRGRYGRLLSYAPALRQRLIEEGLGRPYDGGRRMGWC
ncbi:MAG: hypothetical protein V6Z81_09450 [Parvularculales bacterium]